jgi:hypothetical protein
LPVTVMLSYGDSLYFVKVLRTNNERHHSLCRCMAAMSLALPFSSSLRNSSAPASSPACVCWGGGVEEVGAVRSLSNTLWARTCCQVQLLP